MRFYIHATAGLVQLLLLLTSDICCLGSNFKMYTLWIDPRLYYIAPHTTLTRKTYCNAMRRVNGINVAHILSSFVAKLRVGYFGVLRT